VSSPIEATNPACVISGAGRLAVDAVPDEIPGAGQVTVDVAFGGICGSDLHYWRDGAVGDFQIREPLVPGHEIVGHVARLGPQVRQPEPGTAVAIHPATVCGHCPPCRTGRRNLCENVAYLGSAARMPHVQGGFRQRLVVPADQLFTIPDGLALRRAVLAEPLAVALHAVHRAGDLLGRRVLVTGSGPIGVLVTAAAVTAGASVTVTDLVPQALAVARSVGAATTIALGSDPDPEPRAYDVAIEASGAPAALRTASLAVRRGGTVVLLGMLPPQVAFAGSLAVTRELDIRGSFRFDAEFGPALALLSDGLPVEQVVTAVLPLAEASAAFELAVDRTRSCKVLLNMSGPADRLSDPSGDPDPAVRA